ncbi:MAG: hypothetical protein MJZ70_05000 [Bacteroidales bacterium]|nr:hypothetical protein [Bacteroidales bacterium]
MMKVLFDFLGAGSVVTAAVGATLAVVGAGAVAGAFVEASGVEHSGCCVIGQPQ